MSRYMDIRFKGVVKKELRDIFEPIAMEGKWNESPDSFLKEYGEDYMASKIPMAEAVYAITRWEKEPWKRSYNKETGEWQFYCTVNFNHFPVLEWEDDIIPYCMESVEHYETWLEPVGDEPWSYGTCLEKLIDGELKVVGWFHEDGTFESKEDVYKRIEEKRSKS